MRTHQRGRRAGFTLIELLIVISIIAVLLALSAAAAFRMLGMSSTGATRTLIMRLESQIRHQMTVKADRAREVTIPAGVLTGFGVSGDLARVCYVKLRLKADFPMTFREALDPSEAGDGTGVVPAVRAYKKYLQDRGVTYPATKGAWPAAGAHESACCLYMALRHGQDVVAQEEAGLGGAVVQISGVDCYVDGWGQPLVFCRTPHGSPAAPPSASAPFDQGKSLLHRDGATYGFDDPFDPKFLLLTPSFYGTPGATTFSSLLHPIYRKAPPPAGHQRPTLSPIVMSGGPDQKPGVDLKTLANPTVDSDDNILTERFR